MGATFSLAYRGSLDPDHILYCLLSGSSDTRQARLRSRRPFVLGMRNLLVNLARLGIRASEWTNHKWNAEYCKNVSRLCAFVPETGARPVGMGLPRAAWVKLNRLRTGVGQFHSSMHKWGLCPSPNCECGASEQTADHVLTVLYTSGTTWSTKSDGFNAGLMTSLPASDSSSAAVWDSKRINPRPQSCLCLTWSGYPSKDNNKKTKQNKSAFVTLQSQSWYAYVLLSLKGLKKLMRIKYIDNFQSLSIYAANSTQ